MAPKLVTSQTYVDNIRNFLPEKPNSKTPASEKSKKIFDQIINSPNFIFDKSDKRITDSITTLITIRPGRTLFKRLLKADKPLTIVFDSEKETGCGYDGETKAATIILNDSKVVYHLSVNPKGEKVFTPSPEFIDLAHELIHALHFFEEGGEFVREKRRNFSKLLDLRLDDMEEQETIIGKEEEGTLCENVFNFLFGYPLRISHRGFFLNREDTFTASDCAYAGALTSLKEMLLSNPSLLNLPQQCSGSRIQMTPLIASLSEHWVEISDYLFQLDVDVNAWDNQWGTALHVAVKTGPPDLVKVLLEKGAALDVKDPKGFTALHVAVKTCQPDLVKVLLESGASPNVKDPEGLTALEWALRSEDKEMVELLIPFSNLKEIDEQGLSIVHRALAIISPEMFRTLIRHGADVNCKDLQGNTLLMYCCGSSASVNCACERQKIKILLENDHLDLNAKNTLGESALSLLLHKQEYQTAYLLVQKGAETPPGLEEEAKICLNYWV